MELAATTIATYARRSLDEMAEALDRFDDQTVNVRPFGSGTNSAAALIIHACAAAGFWLEHIGIGRHVDRDREAEFSAEATIDELQSLIAETRTRLTGLAAEFDAGPTATDHELRVFLPDGDTSDGSVAIHALEELFQHLGHLEITADAINAGS